MLRPDCPIPYSSLKLGELQLFVRLGCSEEERGSPQEVRLSVEFRFQEIPRGAFSDSINDTVCYGRVAELLRKEIEGAEFHLIERLGAKAFVLAKEAAGAVPTAITVRKVHPPVAGLLNGADFRCGDFL